LFLKNTILFLNKGSDFHGKVATNFRVQCPIARYFFF